MSGRFAACRTGTQRKAAVRPIKTNPHYSIALSFRVRQRCLSLSHSLSLSRRNSRTDCLLLTMVMPSPVSLSSSATTTTATAAAVRRVYRDMIHHLKHVQKKTVESSSSSSSSSSSLSKKQSSLPTIEQVRQAFRENVDAASSSERPSIEERLREAESRLAVWRMSSIHVPRRRRPSPQQQQASSSSSSSSIWIYKDGKRYAVNDLAAAEATLRDGTASHRVVSNWDGSNLDPTSVTRHNQQLKRLGFVNNLHAKGIF